MWKSAYAEGHKETKRFRRIFGRVRWENDLEMAESGSEKRPRFVHQAGPSLRWGNLLRHENGVDHVDHAVGTHDVRFGDGRVVDLDGASVGANFERLAVYGFRGIELHRLSGSHFSGDDVIGKDGDELLLIFRLEEFVDSAGGEFCEGVVRGSEDGEGGFAF